MADSAYYIGIMSGTSLDGVDVVLVDFAHSTPVLIDSLLVPYPVELRSDLAQLSQPGANEIEQLGVIEADLAVCYANTVQQLLTQCGLQPHQIEAIGCHGQTIRHRPLDRKSVV